MNTFRLTILLTAALLVGLVLTIIGRPSPAARGLILWRRLTNPYLHRHYGSCARCARSWDVLGTNYHTTVYWRGRREIGRSEPTEVGNFATMDLVVHLTEKGAAPLCQDCWLALRTGPARLPYYLPIYATDPEFPAVMTAVLAEQ